MFFFVIHHAKHSTAQQSRSEHWEESGRLEDPYIYICTSMHSTGRDKQNLYLCGVKTQARINHTFLLCIIFPISSSSPVLASFASPCLLFIVFRRVQESECWVMLTLRYMRVAVGNRLRAQSPRGRDRVGQRQTETGH